VLAKRESLDHSHHDHHIVALMIGLDWIGLDWTGLDWIDDWIG